MGDSEFMCVMFGGGFKESSVRLLLFLHMK